ncbi:conserved hypothetical protein [Ricinus communis]|uniref:Uncharacterized protein n=1 Tax=Ricinus communis TaxID=3988 RepID=B9RLQ4_RICCO|nr:conserved hypothetical protein [Ricinus communis]
MVFQLVRTYEQYHRGCDWILGNWFHDLDPSVYDLRPNKLPVGPLHASGRPGSLSP